ncbi:TPA: hypothetical protein SI657_002100 [Escherichia coli]|nr:hypothetical protein [Escherichia coli]HEI2779811.1 hypothetical protein [Escherichia coli]HEI2809778.1 hypothetical protein [Escherichia coli]HEI2830260.1 hypothetical protein [Escherichia coli]HEI3884035.1 hypothetical protein [Escherichia coli]
MLIYFVEIFDKLSDELIQEIRIPEDKLETLSEIMKWNSLEKDSFFCGIGGFNVMKEQALALEDLLGIQFYDEKYIIQISGGEI